MVGFTLAYDRKTEKYIPSMEANLEKGTAKGIIDAMLFAEKQAKLIFKEGGPVLPPPGPLVARTGHLRRSIKSGAKGEEGWIGTKVPYGIKHEFGTSRHGKTSFPARPFLSPSFIGSNLEKINEIISEAVIKELK